MKPGGRRGREEKPEVDSVLPGQQPNQDSPLSIGLIKREKGEPLVEKNVIRNLCKFLCTKIIESTKIGLHNQNKRKNK